MSVLTAAIIGGGAAGYFGAIVSKAAFPDTEVFLLEATDRPLAKVLISGGGRCNVTHACFEPGELVRHYPRGGKELRGAFARFGPREIVEWFEGRGVRLKREEDGRMFPVTDRSETIADCLKGETERLGVEVRLRHRVTRMERAGKRFGIDCSGGVTIEADRVLLASGGSRKGMELARSLGHTIEEPVPSLFTFTVPDPMLGGLAGTSFGRCAVTLEVNGARFREIGPVLITHWGLSGPAVLRLSAVAARALHESQYRGTLRVNWLGDESAEVALKKLLQEKERSGKRELQTTPPRGVTRKFWERLLGESAQELWAEVRKKDLARISERLTQTELQLSGKGEFKEEFVTCGGVRRSEVEWRTMESKICPALFLAGEVLDVDGITGGFNFQSAWTTARIAGQAMGR